MSSSSMVRRSSGAVGSRLSTSSVRNRSNDRLDDPGEIGLIERLWKQLGHLGQAALAVEQLDRIDETRLERGGLAGVQ